MVFVRNPQLRFTFVDNGGMDRGGRARASQRRHRSRRIRLIDPELAHQSAGQRGAARPHRAWSATRATGAMCSSPASLRKIGFDTLGTADNEPSGSELGWGVMLGGAFKWGIATFRLGGVYGEGIASYMNDGGMDLAPSAALDPARSRSSRRRRRRRSTSCSRPRPCRCWASPPMSTCNGRTTLSSRDRLQLRRGRQHQLPGRRPPSTAANMPRPTCSGRPTRRHPDRPRAALGPAHRQ